MRPDQCGTGRPLSSLPPATREQVEKFIRLLHGKIGIDRVTGDWVEPADAAGNPNVYVPDPPGGDDG